MRKIEAIVREEKLQDVLDALTAAKITGITVYQVMGCGTQRGCAGVVRGQKVYTQLLRRSNLKSSFRMKNGRKSPSTRFVPPPLPDITATARSSPMISIPLSVSGRAKRAMTPSTVQRWRSREKAAGREWPGITWECRSEKQKKKKHETGDGGKIFPPSPVIFVLIKENRSMQKIFIFTQYGPEEFPEEYQGRSRRDVLYWLVPRRERKRGSRRFLSVRRQVQ